MRARNNMAMKMDGIEFDTVEELMAYKDAKERRSGSSAPRASAPRSAVPAAALSGRKVTYAQGRAISVSCGGLDQVCPNWRPASGERVSAADVLTDMGLDAAAASRVIEEMTRKGVAWGRSEAQQRQAREILVAVGGVHCPI